MATGRHLRDSCCTMVPTSLRTWLPAATVVGAVGLAYVSALHAPFLFDDADAVVNNPTIRNLSSFAVLQPPADGSTTTGRPLVNLSFALNYALSGTAVWSYHAVNLAIHALAALALMGLVRRTLLTPGLTARFGSHASSISFFTALLWALHPLQSESVTCISQRTESLCGLLYLLTLYAFVRSVQCHVISDNLASSTSANCHLLSDNSARRSPGAWAAASVAACLAGMATKEVMVTAPLVVLLYDRTFFACGFAAALQRRRGYYTALAATWGLLAVLVMSGSGARGASAGFGRGVDWWDYLLKQCEALLHYARLAFWPHPLVLDYGTAVVHSPAEVWWQGPAVLAALAGTIWALWRRPIVGFLGAWFFLILAPSSSFVPLVTQTMAEHRMYLPLAALIIAAVGWAHTRLARHTRWLCGAVALLFAAGTFARNRDYRDAVSIWTTSVVAYPHSARAHSNLAQAWQEARRPTEANTHFARAVALDSRYVPARYNWGVALLEQNRTADAIVQLGVAVQLAPDHADALVNLGAALARADRAAEAVPHFERALQLKPAADVHFNLGTALVELNRDDPAAAHLRAALQLNPALVEAHYQLGRLAERAGRMDEAEAHFSTTLRQAPDHLGAHRRLGLLEARRENLVAAAGHFRALIRIQPSDADARANLGNVLLLQGQPHEAILRYEEALRLRPDDPRTRDNLRLAREALR